MKLFSIVAFAAAIVVASAQQTGDQSQACDVLKFAPLVTNTDGLTCSSDTNFNVAAGVMPTGENLKKFCASTACKNVLAQIKGFNLGDCTVLGKKLQSELLTPLTTACTASGANTTANNQPANNSTANNQPANNSTTNNQPANNTIAASNSTSPDGAATTSPAPSTAPTPSPTSAAASAGVTTASVAIIVALTTAFL